VTTRTIAIVGPTLIASADPIVAFVHTLARGTLVLTTGARGVAQIARDAAKACGLAVDVVLADWSTGRGARQSRNAELARRADEVALWWEGGSEGINVLRAAVKAGKPVRVFACGVTSSTETRTIT
jgi:hypothetical protein